MGGFLRAGPRRGVATHAPQEAAPCLHCLAFRGNTWDLRLGPLLSRVLNVPVILSLVLRSLSGLSLSLECQRKSNKNKALILNALFLGEKPPAGALRKRPLFCEHPLGVQSSLGDAKDLDTP